MKYHDLTPLVLNEVQKQERKLSAQQKLVEQLQAKDAEITGLRKRLVKLEAKDKGPEARLTKVEQFMPPTASPVTAKVALKSDEPPTQ